MSKIIVFNWKSNPDNAKQAINLAKASDHKNVVVCPPFVFLLSIKKVFKKAGLGSQNVFGIESGPYTGEISINQLKNSSVQYVIVGHSERRRHFNEDDRLINQKIKACLKNNLGVILCVGEPEKKIGRNGLESTRIFVKKQLQKALSGIRFKNSDRLFVAYEPVWAIGTGQADEPVRSAMIMAYLRKFLFSYPGLKQISALYGGSIDSRNIEQFLSYDSIDGVLIGSASLKISEVKKIVKIAEFF